MKIFEEILFIHIYSLLRDKFKKFQTFFKLIIKNKINLKVWYHGIQD